MLTDKTAYYEPHMPAFVGKDAVEKFHQAFFGQFNAEMNAPVADVRVVGDLGVVRGTYTQNVAPKADGAATVSDSGNWIVVLQRQGDGAWKWDWVMGNSDQPMPGTTADGAEESALMQIERDWAAAMVKRDMATLDRVIAKEWTNVVDGQLTTRAATVAGLKAGAYQFESMTMRELSVHVFGDAAIATMIGDVKGKYKGADISGSSRSTDFFVKRDGRWQAISTQSTTIKP